MISSVFGSILGFLGLGKAQFGVMVALSIAAAAIIGILWLQNDNLQTKNETLINNNAKLESSIEIQSNTIDKAIETIDKWEEQVKSLQNTMSKLSRVQEEANLETRRLNDVFAYHDLQLLSSKKPGLIERRINDGTSDVFRMFRNATVGDTNNGSESETAK